jgi:hypothetical protein
MRALVVALAALSACGGGGAGGTDGAAGGGDAPVEATDEDAPPPGACFGPCLAAFTAACPKVLGCTTAPSGALTAICYANGVKELVDPTGAIPTGTVKRPDGTLCYRWRHPGTSQDYFDLDGGLVAHFEQHAAPGEFTVTCGPDDVVTGENLLAPECANDFAIASQACAAGACVF